MFRATMGLSSADAAVFVRHLDLFLCMDICLVCRVVLKLTNINILRKIVRQVGLFTKFVQ